MPIEEMTRDSVLRTSSRIADVVSKVETVLGYCFPGIVSSGIANEAVIVAYMGITIEFDFKWDFVYGYVYVTDKVNVQSASFITTEDAIDLFREVRFFIRVIMHNEKRTYVVNPIAKYLI